MSIILQNTDFIQPQHFIESLSSNIRWNSHANPLDIFKDVTKIISEQTLPQLFAKTIEITDQNFFESDYRKKHFYVKDRRVRTIISSFGIITFKRRVYIHNQSYERYYFVDEKLQIRKYQRVLDELLFKMIHELIAEKSSYQKIASRYLLSPTTLYNGLKNLDLSNVNETKPTLYESPVLYVQADEHYISSQKQPTKGKFMVKQVVLFDELERICRGRNRLKQRTILNQRQHESNEAFYTRVSDFIYESLPEENVPTIVARGDGASWIKSLAETVGATFYIDGFHFTKALWECCPRDSKAAYRFLMNYLQAKDYTNFEKIILILRNSSKMDDLPQKTQDNMKYLIQHSPSFFKAQRDKLIGCSAEGMISHYLASQLTRHPKAYNPSIAYTTATLLSMVHNGLDCSEILHKEKQRFYRPATPTKKAHCHSQMRQEALNHHDYHLNLNYKPNLERELKRY